MSVSFLRAHVFTRNTKPGTLAGSSGRYVEMHQLQEYSREHSVWKGKVLTKVTPTIMPENGAVGVLPGFGVRERG
ncbi:MAG: hypothetical protein AAF683_10015 [Pseudomonadota bacterium]